MKFLFCLNIGLQHLKKRSLSPPLWLSLCQINFMCNLKQTPASNWYSIDLKVPALVLLDFFQSYCDFGIIRIVIFFLIIILKFHVIIACRSGEIIKNMLVLFIMVVTTINNYNHPLFELQRQFIFSPVF